jgi:peptide-methionine (S)-S-oxide reductase
MIKNIKSILQVALILFASLSAGGLLAADGSSSLKTATFAGGCFWCMEQALDKVKGVVTSTSGYIGGHKEKPTYSEVSAGRTGHTEAVQVEYDPKTVSYAGLLKAFWKNIDPTTVNRQFCDWGSQYRSGIFYHDDEQKRLADISKNNLSQKKPFTEKIVTEITAATTFYPAEKYHQNYYRKNPVRYRLYKFSCKRTQRLEELWGASDGSDIKK